jgi:probable rRNA maturation factor
MSTPAELRRLNRRFAGLDEVTDVLAFPAGESRPGSGFQMPPGQGSLLGDIVISVGTASAQAEELGQDPRGEVRLLAVHGLLHLLGHDHHEAEGAARMTSATRQLLARDAARRGLLPPRVPALLPSA